MTCLTPEQIERLARNEMSAHEAENLRSHIQQCSICKSAMDAAILENQLISDAMKVSLPIDSEAIHADSILAEIGESDRPGPSPDRFPGYRLVRELSHGGQGVVYEAVQESTKRKVAIKVLLAGAYASSSARKRFEREVELVAQLKHPNIISVFHAGVASDGCQFYVMDYVRGVPLGRYVREQKLTLEDTLKLFSTVCGAVQYAHQRGVIHRDLKPSNILVDTDGNPKLLDFGLARLITQPVETLVSVSQAIIGTLPYMSPEQTRGNPDEIDTRTDVYALGVMLYELLTGGYPYPVAGQMADVLKHIAETPPTPPSRRWSTTSGVATRSTKRVKPGSCPIDRDIQTVVLKSLAKERTRRYQSPGELGRDIDHYLSGEPLEARGDSLLYIIRKRAAHFRIPRYIKAFVGVALGIGVALLIANQRALLSALHSIQRSDSLTGQANNDVTAFFEQAKATLRPHQLLAFLEACQKNRTDDAAHIQQQTQLGTVERAVMDFLLDDQMTAEQLKVQLADRATPLLHYAIGERLFRQGLVLDARRAFELCASSDGTWLAPFRLLSAARLELIRLGEQATSSPASRSE